MDLVSLANTCIYACIIYPISSSSPLYPTRDPSEGFYQSKKESETLKFITINFIEHRKIPDHCGNTSATET